MESNSTIKVKIVQTAKIPLGYETNPPIRKTVVLRAMTRLKSVVHFLALQGSCGFSPPFQTFQFAKNGVCVHPKIFVDQDDEDRVFTMRNVPGEGDCMFLAVALAAATSMGLGGRETDGGTSVSPVVT